MDYLEAELVNLNCPIVFAHNDLFEGNVIADETTNRIYFIDYEYADYNYAAFDIGAHFLEWGGKFLG